MVYYWISLGGNGIGAIIFASAHCTFPPFLATHTIAQFSGMRSTIKNPHTITKPPIFEHEIFYQNQITTQIHRIQNHKHKFGPTKIHKHKSTLFDQCIQNHDQNKTQIGPSYHWHHHLWLATIATQPLSFTTLYLYRFVWIGAWRDPKHQIVSEREWLILRIRVTSFGSLDLEEGIWVFLTWWHLSNSHVGVMWLSIPSIVTLNLMLGWEV